METILVPTDFSDASANAVDYAVELAKFFDAKLLLVNAYSIPIGNAEIGIPMELASVMQQSALDGLENMKKKIIEKNHRELDIECFAGVGFAYDVIKDASANFKADLIVMGIVGSAGKIKEHLIGSTAVKVARHLEIPTFIIPENVKYQRIHHISFACDMEKTEETVLVYIAKYFSRMFDAELEIVNIEKPEEEISEGKAKTEVFMEKKLEPVTHKTVFITGDHVARELETYFETHPTDLIMLNPKKHNVFHDIFIESVTKELAFHIHQPILAIH